MGSVGAMHLCVDRILLSHRKWHLVSYISFWIGRSIGIGITWDCFVIYKWDIGTDCTGMTNDSFEGVMALWSKD